MNAKAPSVPAAERFAVAALRPWRQRADPLADAAVAGRRRHAPRELLAEVEAAAHAHDPAAQEYLDATRRLPAWLDLGQLERGRRVTLAFGAAHVLTLALVGLAGGYRFESPTEILVRTGRLRVDVRARFFETGQMTHNVTARGAVLPGGVGHRTILEVRLLHAMVRRMVYRQGWDDARDGVPVNQLDMALTAREFGRTPLVALERLGARLDPSDREAFQHFWRYVAWLNGVDDTLLGRSCADDDMFYARYTEGWGQTMHPAGREMANALFDAMTHQPPFFLGRPVIDALARRAMGEAMADRFGIPDDRRWARAVDGIVAVSGALAAVHRRTSLLDPVAESLNFALMRHTLLRSLPVDRSRWAFEHVATYR